MDLNKVMIIGRLTRDPEIRTTPNGTNVASFGVATSRSWTDQQSGQKKEVTEFHNIVAWRKLADIIGQYLKKGSQVYVEGYLQTRNYDKDGQKHYRTEIVADNMIMLGRASGGTQAGSPSQQEDRQSPAQPLQPEPPAETPSIQIDDADMPF